MATVSEALLSALQDQGVQRIYGIVGDSLNAFTQSLIHQKEIQWIHTRHEEVAAFAAGAEAQLTGELTVCAGSCGPGNLHLINGLYDCQRSRAPVLAIAAHIPSAEIGSDYFQETHPQILFKDCSVFCELLSSPAQMTHLAHTAIQTALTRRGVAVLVIPNDVATQLISDDSVLHWPKPIVSSITTPTPSALAQAAQLLNQAQKVTLFCGIGVAEAHSSLMKLAGTLQAPIVHTLRGKPFVEYDNPYDVGMTGFIGHSSGYHAMHACDVLVLIGTSFPYRQFYPTQAKVIQIDIEGQQLGKHSHVDLGLIGQAQPTIEALLPLLQPKQNSEHLKQALQHYQNNCADMAKQAIQETDHQGVYPQYLAHLINQNATEDAIFICDVGTPTVWAARYLTMNGKRRLLGSFNHGSMANALAQGIGAQLSHPKRQVIALCGDGGLSMLLGDLLTLIQHNIALKLIVFNNQSLEFVKLEMHACGMLEFGTQLSATNFAAIAEAMHILGKRVENAAQLESHLKEVLAHDGPALLDVNINAHTLIFPPSITLQNVKEFGIYMIKAILDGQGKEIVDLAKSNLWDR